VRTPAFCLWWVAFPLFSDIVESFGWFTAVGISTLNSTSMLSPSLRVLRSINVERSTINAILMGDGSSVEVLLLHVSYWNEEGHVISQYQPAIDRLAASRSWPKLKVIVVESVSVDSDYGRSLDLSHPSALITDFEGRPLPQSKDHPNVNAATRKAQEWVSRFNVESAVGESSSLSGWKTLQY
jgi:hypothetical protein